MQNTLIQAFKQYYGFEPGYITRAPGRVNLIGEHTDYNNGFVLPMAINRHVWIVAHPREDDLINMYSMNFEQVASFSTHNLKKENLPHWTEHLRGVWHLLGQRQHRLPGLDVLIHGDVPVGAGLSSSAALEVALVEMGLALSDTTSFTQTDKALLGVDVEHEFIGVPCGVMDQMASAVSEAGHALLIDCSNLETRPVYLPESVAVVVMDTKTARQLADGHYAKRRQECETAAQILGVPSLRDATLDTIYQKKSKMGDVVFRRAKHIVTENQRVMSMVKALKQGEIIRAGELMNESHHSLQLDFEVSCAELDIMSAVARKQSGCVGARMTGGGFGGCAVALVTKDSTSSFIQNVAKDYTSQTNLVPDIYVFEPGGGSEVVLARQ